MEWILWILGIYLLVGLVISSGVLVMQWHQGEDVLVGDIIMTVIRMVIWPTVILALVEVLQESGITEHTLIKGRAEARMMRKMKEE